MDTESGRVGFATSIPSATIALTPEMIENVRDAASLARMASSWGHGPASSGKRIAGYYYRTQDAITEDVLPAHCMSATRDLVLFLASAIEAAADGETTKIGSTEGESAARDSEDAQPSPPRNIK